MTHAMTLTAVTEEVRAHAVNVIYLIMVIGNGTLNVDILAQCIFSRISRMMQVKI